MNTIFDVQLSAIKGLARLPWVGSSYNDITTPDDRLLIVGESHYHNETEESIQKHNEPSFTRVVVGELAIQRLYWGTKIFPNIHRTFLKNDTFDSSIFWNHVSFYNFIQRVMPTNKGRPTKDDYLTGWKVFFSLIDIIKPDVVLFIGTTSTNFLNEGIQSSGFTLESLNRDEKIGRAWAKSAVIKNSAGINTKIYFIRHTSQFFSWASWNGYLNKVMPGVLSFLSSKVSPSEAA